MGFKVLYLKFCRDDIPVSGKHLSFAIQYVKFLHTKVSASTHLNHSLEQSCIKNYAKGAGRFNLFTGGKLTQPQGLRKFVEGSKLRSNLQHSSSSKVLQFLSF